MLNESNEPDPAGKTTHYLASSARIPRRKARATADTFQIADQ